MADETASKHQHAGDSPDAPAMDQTDPVFTAKISAVVGELYYKQFFILLYLTAAYYGLVILRDALSAPAEIAWLLHGSNALVVGFLAATWVLERQGQIDVTNIYLTPIPISLLMIVNVNLHVVLLDDPAALPRGILLIMAFGIVSMFPWIFWLLVSFATVSHVLVTLYVMGDGGGQMIAVGIGAAMISYGGFVVRYNSIREQVRLNLLNQDRAEKLEQLAKAKDEFIANMSHELRTPLTGLMGMVDLLNEAPLGKEERRYLTTAKTSAETLHVIINDILDLSKMGAGKLTLRKEPFELGQLSADVGEMMAVGAADKGLALAVKIPEVPLPAVIGDKARLMQVMFNLLGNAVKFTEKGQVALDVRLLEEDADTVRVRLTIDDTGVGIAEEDALRLFDRFEQVDNSSRRRQGGTGLGLAISQELLILMGSHMQLESTPGEGSRFWFDLTLEKAPEGALEAGEQADGSATGTANSDRPLKLLVAEDNPVNKMLVEKLISKRSWHAAYVVDGAEAVEAAASDQFDLILMDIQMPTMTGEEAAKAIRAGGGPNQATPIIALTANCMPDDIERYLSLGMTDYISKPIKLDAFFATIARHTVG